MQHEFCPCAVCKGLPDSTGAATLRVQQVHLELSKCDLVLNALHMLPPLFPAAMAGCCRRGQLARAAAPARLCM